MPSKPLLTRQLILFLSIWVFVGGMAAADLFDLTDDLLQPLLALTQAVEPELDEVDDVGGLAATVWLARRGGGTLPERGKVIAPGDSSIGSSPRPLYQQHTQYRI